LDERNPEERDLNQPVKTVRRTRMERRMLEEMDQQPLGEPEGSFVMPECPQEEETHESYKAYAPCAGYDVKKTAVRRTDLTIRLLMGICIVVFAASSFLLGRYFWNIWISRKAGAQLEQVYQQAQQAEETEAPATVPTVVPTAVPAPKATTQAVRATDVRAVSVVFKPAG